MVELLVQLFFVGWRCQSLMLCTQSNQMFGWLGYYIPIKIAKDDIVATYPSSCLNQFILPSFDTFWRLTTFWIWLTHPIALPIGLIGLVNQWVIQLNSLIILYNCGLPVKHVVVGHVPGTRLYLQQTHKPVAGSWVAQDSGRIKKQEKKGFNQQI